MSADALTNEEREVVEEYARTHGRNWKAALRDDWMNGRASGTLQMLRNASYFGPRDLEAFRVFRVFPPKKEAAHA